MNSEEFEAVLALDDRFKLRVDFIRGHRGKGRWRAALRWNANDFNRYLVGDYMHAYSKNRETAITTLANMYANY